MNDQPDKQTAGGFLGMDCAAAANTLPPGIVQEGFNVWFPGDGYAQTKPGLKLVAALSASLTTPGFYLGAPQVTGLAYYDTPTKESMIAYSASYLFDLASTGNAIASTIITGLDLQTVDLSFVQMVDRVFFVRNGIINVMVYSGGSWVLSAVTQFSDGTPMPQWGRIATKGFRLLAFERDGYKLYASAIGTAHNNADWVKTENIRVGDGSGDPARAIVAGQGPFLTVLNARSVYQVDTAAANVADWSSLRVTGLTGCVAERGAINIGQDVFFLSRYGVLRLGALAATDSISPSVALSAPLQSYIDRINWTYIQNAFCTTWNDLLLVALPLDSNERPKHILPYNLRTGMWMTPWIYALPSQTQPDATVTAFAGFTIGRVMNFGDKSETILGDNCGRLMRIDATATSDEADVADPTPITSSLVTRNFDHGAPQQTKQPMFVELELAGTTASAVAVALNNGATDTPFTSHGAVALSGRQAGSDIAGDGTLQKKRFLARTLGRYHEGNLQVISAAGKLRVRSLALSAFIDAPYFT